MGKRLTTKIFIARAKEIHGDKYDYSEVEYVNYKTKVKIICPIHGEFWQTPREHLNGNGCQKCSGVQRMNTDLFIQRAIEVHGDTYDYSKVKYTNNRTKVCIICPVHGEFWQSPDSHLLGCGCPKCHRGHLSMKCCGIGIYDTDEPTDSDDNKKIYITWHNMLLRCNCDNYKTRQPTYIECRVSDAWIYFSNFKNFFLDNYVDGWFLDKDILVKGNKIYSSETCCFVPRDINNLLTTRKRYRGEFPLGVFKVKNGRYAANIKKGKERQVRIGTYDTPEEAFQAYKREKEAWIKEVANKWKDKIKPNVYDALMNYQVEITD